MSTETTTVEGAMDEETLLEMYPECVVQSILSGETTYMEWSVRSWEDREEFESWRIFFVYSDYYVDDGDSATGEDTDCWYFIAEGVTDDGREWRVEGYMT